MSSARSVGALLREWRQRRRVTQIDLAAEAEVSTRHLSFLENGRSQPSRDMLVCLAEKLDIPLRERNTLFLAAGYAPIYPQRSVTDPELQLVRNAIDVVLTGHEPYPAIAVDRHWTLIASNSAVAPLLAGIDPSLLAAPVNVLRFTLHPLGLAPRIANYAQWRLHVFEKLRRQIDASHDPFLIELLREFREYPLPESARIVAQSADREGPTYVIPFQLVTPAGVLSFFFGGAEPNFGAYAHCSRRCGRFLAAGRHRSQNSRTDPRQSPQNIRGCSTRIVDYASGAAQRRYRGIRSLETHSYPPARTSRPIGSK